MLINLCLSLCIKIYLNIQVKKIKNESIHFSCNSHCLIKVDFVWNKIHFSDDTNWSAIYIKIKYRYFMAITFQKIFQNEICIVMKKPFSHSYYFFINLSIINMNNIFFNKWIPIKLMLTTKRSISFCIDNCSTIITKNSFLF